MKVAPDYPMLPTFAPPAPTVAQVARPYRAARRTDPESSKAAAREARRFHGEHDQIALTALRQRPGLTSAELAEMTSLDRWQAGRTLPRLRAAGLVANGSPRMCGCTFKRCLTWFIREGGRG